jgi:hypothetical protein
VSGMLQRQIALIVATVVLIAAIVGIVTNAGEDEATVAFATPTPTLSGAEETDKPEKTRKAATTPAPVATKAPTATTAPVATPAPTGPSANATQPKAGQYMYEQTTDGETSDYELTISDSGSGRQTERSEDGITDVEWRSAGKYVLSEEFQGIECDLEPDALEIPRPLSKDSAWKIDSTCEPFAGVEITIKGEAEVSGTEKRTVGGTSVWTWVIEADVTISGDSPQGSFSSRSIGSERFAPDHGLSVYSKSKTSGTDPQSGETQNASVTRRLTALEPN